MCARDPAATSDQDIGGSGDDIASYAASAAVTVNLATNTFAGGDATGDTLVDVESLSGSANGDSLTGNNAANRLFGQDGADTLSGGGGTQFFYGEADNEKGL